jgi:hypothetical protein
MNTRLLPIMTLVLTTLAAPAFCADMTRARELVTLTSSHEFAAGALKLSLRRNQPKDGFTDAQLKCIDAIPSTRFVEPVTTALAEGLSDEELATAFEFYRSPAGKKLLLVMKANLRGEPQPVEISAADDARIKKFEATSAGNKLLVQAIAVSSGVVSTASMHASIEAIENCPKPAQ